ncbi:hypothetical protein KDH_24600 [Dictyobacter sp. S3.2.2.5]|uniref:Uncharacterized protein n=1 Tax=Dictyobacter halimunensis TaxID=3026934 RepID=A0ABQ6FT31_9CHLR|nr:hypothetical protein KDH_24600 [Dictyobacter sp. S3.2.2.5]
MALILPYPFYVDGFTALFFVCFPDVLIELAQLLDASAGGCFEKGGIVHDEGYAAVARRK